MNTHTYSESQRGPCRQPRSPDLPGPQRLAESPSPTVSHPSTQPKALPLLVGGLGWGAHLAMGCLQLHHPPATLSLPGNESKLVVIPFYR